MNTVKPGLIFLAVCFALCNLQAVSMKPLPIGELSQKADVILNGTVVSKTCQRDEAGRIYTKIELKIAETWKGIPRTNQFTVVYGGGTVGNEQAEVSGQTEYEIGEEVVGFFVLNQRSEGVTIGLSQGKFHVSKDPVTGEKLVYNTFHGAAETPGDAAPPNGSQRNQPKAGVARENRLTLAELKRRVLGGAQ
jgi:hypothetical protein